MEDPGFSREGANPKRGGGCGNLFDIMFAENSMEMKKNDSGWLGASLVSLDLSLCVIGYLKKYI